ncbi:hypothetical protein CIL05_00455 [Virgibacillus profundi]|uniref:DUF624 domain-containing protein n=1 Tax=Virgibacillus profundi TaxID=2024555 RepID=A0A2A2IIM1_9BACI|nr:DUF624 domain-containing protein [Virgibacillus profundi]PAV31166.1 hypothetical protein CIL05_00455 [Virgibacillus profundi]PXY55349.1 DUF624 domain-containing protein [Virgibacillus profundi]
MTETGIFSSDSKLMQFMEWLTRLVHVQLIWILFCLVGLVIGGLFPATIGMFAIIRKQIRGEHDFPVFKTFLNLFKSAFVKANLLGWGMVLLGVSIYYYLQLFGQLGGVASIALVAIVFTLALLYLMTMLFIIPVYVHFDVSVPEVVKHAGIIAVSHPLHVLLMVAAYIAFWFGMSWFPVLLPFIGFSMLAYFLMRIAYAAFTSVEKKMSRQAS